MEKDKDQDDGVKPPRYEDNWIADVLSDLFGWNRERTKNEQAKRQKS